MELNELTTGLSRTELLQPFSPYYSTALVVAPVVASPRSPFPPEYFLVAFFLSSEHTARALRHSS